MLLFVRKVSSWSEQRNRVLAEGFCRIVLDPPATIRSNNCLFVGEGPERVSVSLQGRKLFCQRVRKRDATALARLLQFPGDCGAVRLFSCHTPTPPHKQTNSRDPPSQRDTEPSEDRHHISTEVVNRPSEVFLGESAVQPLLNHYDY